MIPHARNAALQQLLTEPGKQILVIAGLAFGRSDNTNFLHVATLAGAASAMT